MTDSYARTDAPFNFLGRFTESQKTSLVAWVGDQKAKAGDAQTYHQIRAHQLRKSAGLMESFYASASKPIVPSFRKDVWAPGPEGHYYPTTRKDVMPAITVHDLKEQFIPAAKRDDRARFRMNWLRTQIEASEDAAVVASEAPAKTDKLLQDLDRHFADPQYRGTLVKDQTDLYKGSPRFRVHPLDPPTPYELEITGHSLPSQ